MANWIQKSVAGFKKRGTEGSFTRMAKSAGYDSPKEYAHHVMAHKDEASPEKVRKANWLVNISK
jgi:hypothetical protein